MFTLGPVTRLMGIQDQRPGLPIQVSPLIRRIIMPALQAGRWTPWTSFSPEPQSRVQGGRIRVSGPSTDPPRLTGTRGLVGLCVGSA